MTTAVLSREVAIPRNSSPSDVRSHFGRDMHGEHKIQTFGMVVRATEVDEAHSSGTISAEIKELYDAVQMNEGACFYRGVGIESSESP